MTTRFKSAHKLSYPYVQVNMITFSHISVDEVRALEAFCAESNVDEFRLRPDQTGLLGPYAGNPSDSRPDDVTGHGRHYRWTSMVPFTRVRSRSSSR